MPIEAEQRMQDICLKCEAINNVFEEIYVSASVVVCKDVSIIFHLQNMLSKMLFPVVIMSHSNIDDVFQKLRNGNVRMIAMTDVLFDEVTKIHQNELANVTVVFATHDVSLDESSLSFVKDKKIIFI